MKIRLLRILQITLVGIIIISACLVAVSVIGNNKVDAYNTRCGSCRRNIRV